MTFRELLIKTEKVYDPDYNRVFSSVFDSQGKLAQDFIYERLGDTLVLFIVLEMSEVIFGSNRVDLDRELTADEVQVASEAINKGADQLNEVAQACWEEFQQLTQGSQKAETQ